MASPCKTRRAPGLAPLLALVLSAACGPSALDPVDPGDLSAVDPFVSRLVREKLEVARKNPGDAAAHGQLGLVLEANEIWLAAAESLGNAALLDGGQPLWQFHRVLCLRQAGEVQESLGLLRLSAGRLPRLPAVHQHLAYALFDDGQLDEAEAAFERVIELLPEGPEGLVGRGEVLIARGEHGQAVASLERAVELDPGYKSAHYSLGLAYRGLGRLEEASRELNLGVNARRRYLGDDFSGELYEYKVNYAGVMDRAANYITAGQPEVGASMLEKLLRSRPGDVNVLNNLASAYLGMKQFDRAEQLLLQARERDRNEFATYINLAALYLELERLDEALEASDRSVELAPNVGQAHFMRGRVLALQGNRRAAYGAFRMALSLDARDARLYVALGEVASQLDLNQDARAYFEKAVELLPGDLPAHVNLAAILLRLGLLDAAAEAIAAAEKLAPDHPRVADMRRRIDEARRR